MITMFGLFIGVQQRLYQIQPGKRSYMAPKPVFKLQSKHI